MKSLKVTIFIALFVSLIVNAASEKLTATSEALICNQMKMIKNNATVETAKLATEFVYKEFFIRIKSNSADDPVYQIYKKNHPLNQITLKDIGFIIHTNAIICENSKDNQYMVFQDECEQEDASSGTGVLVIDISNNTAKKLYRDNFDDERYTPKKLLNQQKYLPITPTLFEKDSGLYMKDGSTYKSDTITVKKPTSMK